MKTKIYRILLALPVLAMMTACEGMLNLTPEDRVTPATFFNTESNLELFTNNFYPSVLPGGSIYEDEADGIINPILDEAISGQRIIPETSSGVDGWGWDVLRQINYYLENSHMCEDTEARNHYDGVARFFRAYFYFYKVRRFGDVPWYDHVIGSADREDLDKPRDSRELVMQNIIADLDWAADNLRQQKDVYRVTRWTALALKSRICLFEGTFRKYHGLGDWEKYLEECEKASDLFMTESGYTLYNEGSTPYKDLFTSMDAIPEEIIMARDYSQSLSLTHGVQNYEISSGSGCAGVTRRIVGAYLMSNGERFSDQEGYEKMTFLDEVKDRDPRLAQTFRTPGYTIDGVSAPPDLRIAKLGYQPMKYYISKQWDNSSCVDLPLFRTAEVYLNFAEAKAELGTLTQEDLDRSVNLIRNRADMPDLNKDEANADPDEWLESEQWGYPNVDKGANKGVILEIRRERTVELFMEGFRYYDMMRWKEGKVFEKPFLGMYIPAPGNHDLDGDGTPDVYIYDDNTQEAPDAAVSVQLKLGERIYLYDPETGQVGNKGYLTIHQDLVRHWNEDRDYLYPIPTKDRILTNGALSQNPGWDDGLPF